MSILWSNNASTTVSGSITATATSVMVAAGTGVLFPSPTGGDYFVMTFYDQATKTQNEIVSVTARSGDLFTIVRAQEGTTARAWNAGDIAANLVTAGTLRAFVQTGGTPAANTSIVYVGVDTGTVNHIVAVTTPVPASLSTGMLFNIKIKNTCTGPTDMALNGGAAVQVVRQNGAALVGNDVIANMEMIFVYNGVSFNAMVPDIKQHPPQSVFYVNTSGNDNNTGLANTPTDAFATIQGAINAIKSRYISQIAITIRVADGTYIGGFGDTGTYITSWTIIGNYNNPANCIIDARSTAPPAPTNPCIACVAYNACTMVIQGFTFKSYYPNIDAYGGYITPTNCNFTGPVGGSAPIWATASGEIIMSGTFNFDAAGVNVQSLYQSEGGAFIQSGYQDVITNRYVSMNIVGNPIMTYGTVSCFFGGTWGLNSNTTSWGGGTPQGPKFYIANCGGIITGGMSNTIPGSQPGIVVSPGWLG